MNPEAPWPEIDRLAVLCEETGYPLRERLTIYPEYVDDDRFLDEGLRKRVREMADDAGLAR